jgi:hypothetical protein
MVAGKIKEAEPTVAVLASIGALGIALLAAKASKAAFKIFIRPGKKLKKLGQWAVVTGMFLQMCSMALVEILCTSLSH